MNTNEGYVMNRMNLDEVCAWLIKMNQDYVAKSLNVTFKNHIWNKNGMMRTDVIKEIFELTWGLQDGKCSMWRQLQCDVATIMNVVPLHEAHVD